MDPTQYFVDAEMTLEEFLEVSRDYFPEATDEMLLSELLPKIIQAAEEEGEPFTTWDMDEYEELMEDVDEENQDAGDAKLNALNSIEGA